MIFSWCRKQKTDFIFLQETHSKSDTETQWKNEWGGEIFLSHGSPNSCGMAILLKKRVDCVIHSKILDPQGRYIKHMQKLKISGSIRTDPFNILSDQKLFYQDPYTSKNIKVDSTQTAKSFLSNLDIPRLTEEQKLLCEGKITPEECAAVLENFQNN